MNTRHQEIAIVGAGPRGLSVLERLCAQERKSPSCEALTVHVVDPSSPGPGRVWRTAQSRHLLMNTVASQVSLFTDASVCIDGPVEEGPSLYEWAQDQLRGGATRPAALDDPALAEARDLGPDSYPTRAFYGAYLTWVFQYLLDTAPGHLDIRVHRREAVALDDEDPDEGPGAPRRGAPTQRLGLADGTVLDGLDAVVLAQGHVPAHPTRTETELAAFADAHGLRYLPPANPADADLDAIAPGETVILRGMGLNFFDYMALLTAGRGGTFDRGQDGRLRYRASGREPRLVAGSRRGVPYHARGENEKGAHGRHHPRLLTPAKAAEFRARTAAGERVRFGTDVWPLIAAEVESVYYGTLLTSRGRDGDSFAARYAAAASAGARDALLDAEGITGEERWDWERVALPYRDRVFTGPDDHRAWLLDHLRADVAHARAGNVSGPLKAALDVLRDLRNEIRLTVDHGGLEGTSHHDDLEGWYTPLNAFLSIGPPTSRIEELIALVEAGVVEITAPGMRVGQDGEGADSEDPDGEGAAFTVTSSALPGVRHRARVLIEARLPEPDLRRTADPLMRHLLDTGQCAPYRIPAACGRVHETGGLSVTERPYHVVDAAGRTHPRRFAYGVPTESVHWVTAAGIRPGVGSVTLEDSDAIAQAVRALSPVGSDAVRLGAAV